MPMEKSELIEVLDAGLKQSRITEEQYQTAVELYKSIYEIHIASESSEEHATLASIINTASGTTPEELRNKMTEEWLVAEEIRQAEAFIELHPILNYSPGDLRRAGRSLEEYLKDFPDTEQEIYLEYFDEELPVMTEEVARVIREIGPLKVLQHGLENGNITKEEFDEHQKLAFEFDPDTKPENHAKMVSILLKAYGGTQA